MGNSTPERPMLARQNDGGVSVNESSVCVACSITGNGVDESHAYWTDAEDVTNPDTMDDTLYPIDNPDGRCNGCGATALFPDA